MVRSLAGSRKGQKVVKFVAGGGACLVLEKDLGADRHVVSLIQYCETTLLAGQVVNSA